MKELDLDFVPSRPYLPDLFEKTTDTFRALTVENGVITWSNGADIDPDVLYYGLTPAWMEQAEKVGVANERS